MKSSITIQNFAIGKKGLWNLIALALLLPYPISWVYMKLNPLLLIDGAEDVATWIGFSGNYIGGIMGGIISILILNKTLQQTAILHHDLKILQIDTISYTQQQEWFTGFRHELAENLKSIDLYVLNTIVSSISMKNYIYAKDILMEINKNLEYQMVASSFTFSSFKLSKEEKNYMDTVRKVQMEYSSFIKDILFYIPLAETMNSRKNLDFETLMDYTLSQYNYLQEQTEQCAEEKKIIPQIMEISPEADIGYELDRIIEERLTGRTCLYRLKSELAEVTRQLIVFEEKRIESFLEHKE